MTNLLSLPYVLFELILNYSFDDIKIIAKTLTLINKKINVELLTGKILFDTITCNHFIDKKSKNIINVLSCVNFKLCECLIEDIKNIKFFINKIDKNKKIIIEYYLSQINEFDKLNEKMIQFIKKYVGMNITICSNISKISNFLLWKKMKDFANEITCSLSLDVNNDDAYIKSLIDLHIPIKNLCIDVNGGFIDSNVIPLLTSFPLREITLQSENFISQDNLKCCLSGLQNMQIHSLNLHGTDIITDDDFKYFKNFPLKEITIQKCEITGIGFKMLNNTIAENIKKIIISNTHLNDEGLLNILKFKNINYLDVSYTNITDEGLQNIKNLTRTLKKFILSGCDIKHSIKYLGELTNLEYLNISETNISELHHLKNLYLKGLSISKCPISDLSACLKEKDNLSYLYANGCPITDKSLVNLGKIKLGIEILDLSDTQITNQGLLSLTNLNKIDILKIYNCSELTLKNIKEFEFLFPNIDVRYDDITLDFKGRGGGLMQLVAYGAQDAYLTGNPGLSWTFAKATPSGIVQMRY